MMLGKRPRPNLIIKRTTSMTEFTLDPIPPPADEDQIDGTTAASAPPQAVQPQPSSVLMTTASPRAPAPLAPSPVSPVLADPRFAGAVALSNAGMAWPSAAGADESGGRGIGGVHMMRRRNSADFVEDANATTPHFLRDCSLCKRRLGPGRDIYMYRGDSAFCSLECRQQQISRDLRKERPTSAANRDLVEKNSTTAPSPNLPTEPVGATAAAV